MPELAVIAPLRPMAVGDQFEQGAGTVPLHVTALPKFRVSQGGWSAVVSTIIEVAAETRPITATAAAYAHFGRAGDVRVTTVELSAELRRLHLQLLGGVRSAGAAPFEPSYNGDGYHPHITHTREGQAVHAGLQVELRQLAILDCTGPTRRILATAPLTESTEQPTVA